MDSRETPRGREGVRDALIAAAIELFSERGPKAVSVREIAKRAQVNHGLVHRHFGSKEGLVRAVQDRLASDIAATVGGAQGDESLQELLGSIFGATSQQGHWLRILAWSVLDGEPETEIQENFPLADRMLLLQDGSLKACCHPKRGSPTSCRWVWVSCSLGPFCGKPPGRTPPSGRRASPRSWGWSLEVHGRFSPLHRLTPKGESHASNPYTPCCAGPGWLCR